MAKVVGGWALGLGALGMLLTGGEFSTGEPGPWAIASAVGAAGGAAVFTIGFLRFRAAHRPNMDFLKSQNATSILAARRELETRFVRARQISLAVFLVIGTAFFLLAGTYSCVEQPCLGNFEGHLDWIQRTRVWSLVAGAILLPITALARVHIAETNRIEVIASDYQRRREDDDPLGLKISRWE